MPQLLSARFPYQLQVGHLPPQQRGKSSYYCSVSFPKNHFIKCDVMLQECSFFDSDRQTSGFELTIETNYDYYEFGSDGNWLTLNFVPKDKLALY